MEDPAIGCIGGCPGLMSLPKYRQPVFFLSAIDSASMARQIALTCYRIVLEPEWLVLSCSIDFLVRQTQI